MGGGGPLHTHAPQEHPEIAIGPLAVPTLELAPEKLGAELGVLPVEIVEPRLGAHLRLGQRLYLYDQRLHLLWLAESR